MKGVAASASDPDVGAGPLEAVQFRGDDPTRFPIQAEIPLYRSRNLHAFPALGLAMRDRRHQQLRAAVRNHARDYNHDRAVFQPLFLPVLRFVGPQIGVAEDVSRFGRLP